MDEVGASFSDCGGETSRGVSLVDRVGSSFACEFPRETRRFGDRRWVGGLAGILGQDSSIVLCIVIKIVHCLVFDV